MPLLEVPTKNLKNVLSQQKIDKLCIYYGKFQKIQEFFWGRDEENSEMLGVTGFNVYNFLYNSFTYLLVCKFFPVKFSSTELDHFLLLNPVIPIFK